MIQMRKTTLWCRVVLGSLMIGTAGTAAANDSGFYMGVDAGSAVYPDRLSLVGAAPLLTRDHSEKRDFGWAFAAGYRFNSYVAVELGFADLGTVTTKLVDASGATTNAGKASLTARGKTLAMLAHLPSGNWDPYLKFGVMSAVVDRRVDAMVFVPGQVVPSGAIFTAEDDDLKAVVGMGVRYAFSDQWAMSVAVDYYPHLAHRATDNARPGNVTSPRLGFAYRF